MPWCAVQSRSSDVRAPIPSAALVEHKQQQPPVTDYPYNVGILSCRTNRKKQESRVKWRKLTAFHKLLGQLWCTRDAASTFIQDFACTTAPLEPSERGYNVLLVVTSICILFCIPFYLHPPLSRTALWVARRKVVFSGMIVILFMFRSFVPYNQFFFGSLEQVATSEQCHHHMDSSSRTCGAHVSGQAVLESISIEHLTGTSYSLGTCVSHCKAVSQC